MNAALPAPFILGTLTLANLITQRDAIEAKVKLIAKKEAALALQRQQREDFFGDVNEDYRDETSLVTLIETYHVAILVTFPGQPFNQQMTVPVELTLRSTTDGPRLFAWPVKEVAARSETQGIATLLSIDRLTLPAGKSTHILAPGAALDLFDAELELELQSAEKITLKFCGTPVVYDVKSHKLTCRHVTAVVKPVNGRLALRVLGDHGSLEIFANTGATALSVAHTPIDQDFSIQTEGGTALLHHPRFGNLQVKRDR